MSTKPNTATAVAPSPESEKVRATFNLDRKEVEKLQEIAKKKGIPVTAVLRQMIRDMTDIQEQVTATDSKVVLESQDDRIQLFVPSFRAD